MKRLIAITLILCVAGCALRPAPITTLDVRATLAGLPPQAQGSKAVELSREISERKQVLHDYVDVHWAWWVFAPITTGIVYGCYTPARRASYKEIRQLECKEKIISEILDGGSDPCESDSTASDH